MPSAPAQSPTDYDWVPLSAVGAELGITRSAVYLMVVNRRLEGMQCGPRWYVHRRELEAFKRTYTPAPTAGRRFGPRAGHDRGPEEVAALLRDWGEATVEELAEVVERHPGNVRKYLQILKARGRARRLTDGHWSLT